MHIKGDAVAKILMPVKAKPYKHQIEAFNFVCKCFGLIAEGGVSDANGRGDLPDLRQAISKVGKPSP
jgi:hypothetical protein